MIIPSMILLMLMSTFLTLVQMQVESNVSNFGVGVLDRCREVYNFCIIVLFLKICNTEFR